MLTILRKICKLQEKWVSDFITDLNEHFPLVTEQLCLLLSLTILSNQGCS